MRHFKLVPSWLRFLMIFLLVICILFRFFNIESKVYSLEETYTSLRISGYTVAEVKSQIFNGQIIDKESILKFQNLNVDKGFNDTTMSLAVESPEHSPLYYIIARFWVEIFGNSVRVIRYLSAIASLLIFPSIYWLCRELFDVQLSLPILAIALTANSPIYLIYAQEAREYIFWLVTIILASAALLRAIRLNTKENHDLSTKTQLSDPFTTWGIYVITLALSLYICLWSAFVAVAHGVYIIFIAKFRITELVRSYVLATVFGFLAFVPWLMIAVANFFQFILSSDGSSNQDINFIPLMPFLLMQVSRIFLDLNISWENPINYLIISLFLILLIYAIYYLCVTTKSQVWLFLIILIIVPALPLIWPALVSGGIPPGSEPYLIPSYLGIQLIVAYLLAIQIHHKNITRRSIWQVILVFLIICGLATSRLYYPAETWWNKGVSSGNPQIASLINQKPRPLVITNFSETNYGNVVSLSYLLNSKVRFILMPDQSMPNISNDVTDIFLLNPTNQWRQQIANRYQLQPHLVYGDDDYLVWKLVKKGELPEN
ncbi:glycosyltransferase family 39 protein [Nostoc sp. TCL26-01]|uniref:glycosyltransferase family 39 protein n=1 Tax=Nostoc sp. TCL26-01 TaxID=2576904 RepID=UPI0015BA53AC|nr:glycosyltransferase family 39 protein [Nostoc sp. TCL26-01]QLE55111.1 hypothetical protein FD725_06050 [Nostoc sp. TCL26-01]